MTAEQQARIVEVARSWLGTPFHYAARVKGVGVDCGNLLAAIYIEAGLLPAEFPIDAPPPGWHLHTQDERYLRLIMRYAVRVASPWEAGDVLVYRGRRWPSAGHAGIYIDDYLLHAVARRGVELWPLSSSLLVATFDSGWRWNG